MSRRRTRVVAVGGWLATIAAALLVSRVTAAGRAPASPDRVVSTITLTSPDVVATTTPISTTSTTSSTTTVGVVAPDPSADPAPDTNTAIETVVVGFLRGWVLRASIDARYAALADYATDSCAAVTAYTDPYLNALPPGDQVTVDSIEPADLTAAAHAVIDGLSVNVDLVRTGIGWRVNSYRPA